MTLWQRLMAMLWPSRGNGDRRRVEQNVETTSRLVREVREAREAYREERAVVLPSVGVVLDQLRREPPRTEGGRHD